MSSITKLCLDTLAAMLDAMDDTPEVQAARAKYEQARERYEAAVEAMENVERSNRTRSDDELIAELGDLTGSGSS